MAGLVLVQISPLDLLQPLAPFQLWHKKDLVPPDENNANVTTKYTFQDRIQKENDKVDNHKNEINQLIDKSTNHFLE